jgi:hypothetical protein
MSGVTLGKKGPRFPGFGQPAPPDRGVLAQFAFLVIALAGLCVASGRHAMP